MRAPSGAEAEVVVSSEAPKYVVDVRECPPDVAVDGKLFEEGRSYGGRRSRLRRDLDSLVVLFKKEVAQHAQLLRHYEEQKRPGWGEVEWLLLISTSCLSIWSTLQR